MNATPLTNDEIKDLLTSTLHGPLHKDTMNRVFASLVALTSAREIIKTLQSTKADEPDVEAEFWHRPETGVYYTKLWTDVYTQCIDPNEVVTYGDICDRAVRMANAACLKVYKINYPTFTPGMRMKKR